jgi:hypothetical protein
MSIPGFMLVREAAAELGVSQQRIRQLTGNNKLPSQKIGPALIIPITAIAERKQQQQKAKRAKKNGK